MEHTLANLAVLITGPMVGVEIAVALFTNPVFDRLPDAAYRLARSRGSRLLGRVMPFWYIAVLVVLAATAWTTGGQSLITAAAAVMAVVVLLTVTAMVPINNQISSWADTADISRELAQRWDRLHWLRVVLLIVLYVLLTLGVSVAE